MHGIPRLEGRYTVTGEAAHEGIEQTVIPADHLPLQLSSPQTLFSYSADSSQQEKSIKYLIKLCSIY